MNSITLDDFRQLWHAPQPTLTLHTSGSTGRPKPWIVEKERMRASARMTCRTLGLGPGDSALLCLPLHHIAGQMMAVRAWTCGLHLHTLPADGHPFARPLPPLLGRSLAALVPLQAWNTLQVPEERERMAQADHLLIGGGAVDPALEAELRTLPKAVWSTYGMTETLSHIALRPIREAWYRPLPGIQLEQDREGCLVIDAPALCPQRLHTHDIVRPHPTLGLQEGGFQVVGRSDNVICSGGVKIHIEEVEQALCPAFGQHVMVTAVPHSKFGEVVVYLADTPVDEHLMRLCIDNPYWLPKRIIQVPLLPRTASGKPDRAEARRMAAQAAASLRGKESPTGNP